jgi:hypothetical protein
MMIRLLFIVVALVCCSGSVMAQTFSGVVTDGTTNKPIAFASVSIKGSSARTIADEFGRYSLTLAVGEYTLVANAVGYKTLQRNIVIPETNATTTIVLLPYKYALQEISVFSRPSANGATIEQSGMLSVSKETVEKTSGMFKEPFRVVQTMPGVTSNNELSARFNVRGGNQDENLVLVNGAQVFEPYHAKYAAQGSVGVFNLDLVEKIDIMTGGFSAEYGDRMSSVLNLTYREGKTDAIHGSAGVSLTNVDALLEGPIANGGAFVVGFRQSYVRLLMGLLGLGTYIKPSFYDVQGQASYRFSPFYTLRLQGVHSGDDFIVDPNPTETLYGGSDFVVNNTRVRWTQQYNRSTEVRSAYTSSVVNLQNIFTLSPTVIAKATLSYYNQVDDESGRVQESYKFKANDFAGVRTYFNNSIWNTTAANLVRVQTLEARATADAQLSSSFDVRAGVSYQHIHYYQLRQGLQRREYSENMSRYPDISNRERSIPFFGNTPTVDLVSFKLNGYVETITQIDESLFFNIGGRFDYFGVNQDLNLSPRVNASYQSPFGTTFRAAWGFYYQSPLYNQLLYSAASDSNTKAQRAIHYILSAEHRFDFDGNGNGIVVKIDGYHKVYSNLISAYRITQNDAISNAGVLYSRRNDAEGFAQGIDVFAVVHIGWFKGWISYGLLNAQERLLSDSSSRYHPRYTDQRHTLSLVTDFNLGNDWSAGIRYTLGSGFAYTPNTPYQHPQTKEWAWIPQAKNSAYYPAYSRLDIRCDKRFTIFGLAAFAFIDVTNVLNQTNVFAFDYSFNSEGKPVVNTVKLWPILPTLGLTIQF